MKPLHTNQDKFLQNHLAKKKEKKKKWAMLLKFNMLGQA